MEDIQQSYYEEKKTLHEGPIHTICSVNENLIVSGGADKVVSALRRNCNLYKAAYIG